MANRSVITDSAQGTGQYAGATPIGELLIAGFGNLNNISMFQSMDTIGAFNFFGPISGQQFTITSICFAGPSNATVSIYEAANQFTSSIDRLLFKMNLRAAGQIAIPLPFGGFIITSEGEYINAITDLATVNLNVAGYYHPIIHNLQ